MHTDASHKDILHIRVQDHHQLDEQLDKAVSILAERASLRGGQGILVTRHSAKDFIAQLHPDIPSGTIQERREW